MKILATLSFVTTLMLSLLLPTSVLAADDKKPAVKQTFTQYIAAVKLEAKKQGISDATLANLDGLMPDPRMVKFDRKQPEFVQTFDQYLDGRVSKFRIKKAQEKYRENKEVLDKIAATYNIDVQFLLAFWGLESNFGTYQGKYSILRSLATLGFDQRRAKFFTGQLYKALTILDEGHIEPEKFVGGWAGAMGQNQFMPSSFLNYAQDFDGDGKKNIWGNEPDVWASIAYYLQKNGWKKGQVWGLKVGLSKPLDFEALKPEKRAKGCRAFKYHTKAQSLKQWQQLGIELTAEQQMWDQDKTYPMVIPKVVQPKNQKQVAKTPTTAYLVGPNFRGILAYNCANKYAVSVGLLSDYVVQGAAK